MKWKIFLNKLGLTHLGRHIVIRYGCSIAQVAFDLLTSISRTVAYAHMYNEPNDAHNNRRCIAATDHIGINIAAAKDWQIFSATCCAIIAAASFTTSNPHRCRNVTGGHSMFESSTWCRRIAHFAHCFVPSARDTVVNHHAAQLRLIHVSLIQLTLLQTSRGSIFQGRVHHSCSRWNVEQAYTCGTRQRSCVIAPCYTLVLCT